jgi:hypothetical protein
MQTSRVTLHHISCAVWRALQQPDCQCSSSPLDAVQCTCPNDPLSISRNFNLVYIICALIHVQAHVRARQQCPWPQHASTTLLVTAAERLTHKGVISTGMAKLREASSLDVAVTSMYCAAQIGGWSICCSNLPNLIPGASNIAAVQHKGITSS